MLFAHGVVQEAVALFKIKEELLEKEEEKERTRQIDMLRSAAYQMKDIMQDEEMTENEKREFIDTLVEVEFPLYPKEGVSDCIRQYQTFVIHHFPQFIGRATFFGRNYRNSWAKLR